MTASIIVVIPARGGSKRLPNKNLRLLAGESLIQRAARQIATSELGAPVYLSTDSEEIATAGRDVGWEVPFLRPAELARDNTPTFPVVLHLLDWLTARGQSDPDLVLLVQLTSPLRSGQRFREAVELLTARPEIDAVVGVQSLNRPAGLLFRRAENDMLVPLADKNAESVVTPNGALYLIRTTALRAESTFYPVRTIALPMDSVESVDIDTAADWALAEAFLAAACGVAQ